MIATKKFLSVLFTGALAASASAADYYVRAIGGDDNNDGSSDAPFATIDKAISTAAAGDNIYVSAGTYSTTTQYGPNLKAKLIGTGASRDDVVIQSDGEYRTLRMAADSWLENVTVVGEGTQKADKGGAIEMSGGIVTNCVVRNGSVKNTKSGNEGYLEGGNIYMTGASLVVDCVVTNGAATKRGGNIYASAGTVSACTVKDGVCDGNIGGNIYVENGTVFGCTIENGTATSRGGNVFLNHASALVSGCTLRGGLTTSSDQDGGGSIYLNLGTVTNSTVSGGTAAKNGGNIYVNNSSALVAGCTITGGTANINGGNIYIASGVVSDSAISGGEAKGSDWTQGGGNVFMGTGRLTRCRVSSGIAGGNRGGGIRSRNENIVIEDCLVFDNPTGGICLEGKGTHYNNTIVNNGAYGIWGYGSNPGTFVNCVVYGNLNADSNPAEWAGNHPAAADMYNCAFGQERLKGEVDISTYYANCIYLSDGSAFANYSNGDYSLAAGSALVDKGSADSRASASTTDLLGNPRTSGQVDIGCYEYQKSEMTINFAYAEQPDHAYAPATAVFSLSANNVPEGQSASFSIDFGDGSEPVVSAGPTISHEFENPGVYTIVVTASATGADDAQMTYPNFVALKSQTVYVSAGNASPAAPYSTPATGFATVADAYNDAVDGMTIIVGNGVYEQTAKIAVAKAVSIIGNAADPGAVVLCNTATATSEQRDKRVMSIENANALVCGLTLQGGQVYYGNGGNMTVSAGMISNCVIRGGVAYADTNAEFGMGAGVAISGSGVVSHCVITNNEVRGEASGKWVQGGAVVFPWGSSGQLRHCLVAGNRWIVESETANGSAGILYHGSTTGSRVENCTVVANEIVGACGPSCAAGIRCDWNSVVRNTAIAGNRIGAAVSNVFLAQEGATWKDGLNNCITEDALPSGNASCSTATVDEMFRDYASGDYRPKTKGALYDKGIDLLVAVSVDLAGEPRVFGKAIDIGCYESQMKGGFVIVVK